MTKRKSWADRLAAAEERGTFSRRDVMSACNWGTCAIGERHDWSDEYRYMLAGSRAFALPEYTKGMEFMNYVKEGNISEAKRIYTEIQALP